MVAVEVFSAAACCSEDRAAILQRLGLPSGEEGA